MPLYTCLTLVSSPRQSVLIVHSGAPLVRIRCVVSGAVREQTCTGDSCRLSVVLYTWSHRPCLSTSQVEDGAPPRNHVFGCVCALCQMMWRAQQADSDGDARVVLTSLPQHRGHHAWRLLRPPTAHPSASILNLGSLFNSFDARVSARGNGS